MFIKNAHIVPSRVWHVDFLDFTGLLTGRGYRTWLCLKNRRSRQVREGFVMSQTFLCLIGPFCVLIFNFILEGFFGQQIKLITTSTNKTVFQIHNHLYSSFLFFDITLSTFLGKKKKNKYIKSTNFTSFIILV